MFLRLWIKVIVMDVSAPTFPCPYVLWNSKLQSHLLPLCIIQVNCTCAIAPGVWSLFKHVLKRLLSRLGALLPFTHHFGCVKNISLWIKCRRLRHTHFYRETELTDSLKPSFFTLRHKSKRAWSIMIMLMIHIESGGPLKTTHTNSAVTLWGYILLLCACRGFILLIYGAQSVAHSHFSFSTEREGWPNVDVSSKCYSQSCDWIL